MTSAWYRRSSREQTASDVMPGCRGSARRSARLGMAGARRQGRSGARARVHRHAGGSGRGRSPEAAEPAREDENPTAGYVPGYRRTTSVGLSPLSPEFSSALPGGIAPSFGAPQGGKAWRFDFHGYMQGGIRAGIGTRSDALEHQHTTTLHGDPAVAGASYGWFDHSNSVPGPWTQLNFIYGNERVQATVILGAWSLSESMQAAGFFQAPAQQGVVDAFLTYTPDLSPVGLKLITGAYQDRYGAMAQYSEGTYGVSLIGSISGVGTTATLELPFEGDLDAPRGGGLQGPADPSADWHRARRVQRERPPLGGSDLRRARPHRGELREREPDPALHPQLQPGRSSRSARTSSGAQGRDARDPGRRRAHGMASVSATSTSARRPPEAPTPRPWAAW